MEINSHKYQRLVSNTVLFTISTFSSKILSFLLTRLYTGVLTQASYGVVDLVVASGNLLIPLVSLGISNAVIRFGLEKDISKKGVFTAGFVAIFSGFSALLLFVPLISKISVLQGNVTLMYIFVLFSCLRTLCCQFVRARQYTRLYAIDGILSTAYTIGFNVLFLVVLDMGTAGYLLSIICADLLSIIFLFVAGDLKPYVDFGSFDKNLFKTMLRYSLPLVPAMMFWWVTTASDRFFIAYLNGTVENGLYAAANKIPTIVALVSTIFTEAWQLSAVTDGQGADRNEFFSQVYNTVAGFAFVLGGALIVTSPLVMRFLVAPDYFLAWRYVPLLVLASVFSALVAFLNSVYMVEKRSGLAMATMLVGAVANLFLNALFVPKFGPNGAAFATFLSFLIVFIIRVINTRDLIQIDVKPIVLALNTLLLLLMSWLLLQNIYLWPLWCGIIMAALVLLNLPSLAGGFKQIFGLFKRLIGRA